MDEDTVTDLKQFIAATITQQTSDIKEDIAGIKDDIGRLEQKVDDGFAGVGEAIEGINQRFEEQDDKNKVVERRLTKFEQQTA